MKLLMLSVVMGCQLFAAASQGVCQEAKPQPERLHFAFSFPQGHKVLFELTATSAQRVLSSSVLQLTGNVEVRMTTCPPHGHGCVTSPMVLHADAVDYNEVTGQINAHGDVHTAFIELSPRGHRRQGYAPEPLQRPVLARAGSATSQ
jgi:lipopolysaccharide assembly outer membrane protein LptD (OstA)